MRYAPDRVVFNTANAIRGTSASSIEPEASTTHEFVSADIYGHQAEVTKFKNYEVLSRQAANTLTLRDKTQHAHRRRVVSQAFSESSLRLFEPKILPRIDRFCEMLRNRSKQQSSSVGGWTESIDMSHECKFSYAFQ